MITRGKLAKEIGKRIKEIRERKGISLKQFELYENSIARGRMSEFENGNRLPSIINLYRIADVLGVKVSDIIND